MAAIGRFSVLLRNGSHYELANTRLTEAVNITEDGVTTTYPVGNNWGWSSSTGGTSGTKRYGVALKCDNVAIAYSKSPIQIPIPQQSPELIDLGIFRPSITLSGIVDSTSNVTTDPFMEQVDVTSKTSEYSEDVLTNNYTARYYLPYKNVLENITISWINTNSTNLELQVGDMDVPIGSNHTGGSNYKVAIQQCRFQQDAAREDRWTFSMQLIAKAREDYIF